MYRIYRSVLQRITQKRIITQLKRLVVVFLLLFPIVVYSQLGCRSRSFVARVKMLSRGSGRKLPIDNTTTPITPKDSDCARLTLLCLPGSDGTFQLRWAISGTPQPATVPLLQHHPRHFFAQPARVGQLTCLRTTNLAPFHRSFLLFELHSILCEANVG